MSRRRPKCNIFARTTDPVVFDQKIEKLEQNSKTMNGDQRAAVVNEILSAVPFLDNERKERFFAFVMRSGTKGEKRLIGKFFGSPKDNRKQCDYP